MMSTQRAAHRTRSFDIEYSNINFGVFSCLLSESLKEPKAAPSVLLSRGKELCRKPAGNRIRRQTDLVYFLGDQVLNSTWSKANQTTSLSRPVQASTAKFRFQFSDKRSLSCVRTWSCELRWSPNQGTLDLELFCLFPPPPPPQRYVVTFYSKTPT